MTTLILVLAAVGMTGVTAAVFAHMCGSITFNLAMQFGGGWSALLDLTGAVFSALADALGGSN